LKIENVGIVVSQRPSCDRVAVDPVTHLEQKFFVIALSQQALTPGPAKCFPVFIAALGLAVPCEKRYEDELFVDVGPANSHPDMRNFKAVRSARMELRRPRNF